MVSGSQHNSLESILAKHTVTGELVQPLENGLIQCVACGHRCKIPLGRPGVCKIRYNEDGKLKVPFGYAAALQCDPIEKKPFFHVFPGSLAMSFGMLGCDYHCAYCQNWVTSQTLRDTNAGRPIHEITQYDLIQGALTNGAKTVTSTYNEPLITSEWAVAIFQEAKKNGLHTSYVSNGNGTPEVIDYISPWTDYYKIDLKSFRDKEYRKLGGTLNAVLDTIRLVKEKGMWLEIVTLIVPGMNDDPSELREMAHFIHSVNPEIPWHVTAFHEDYKMSGMGNTTGSSLLQAAEIGKEQGLQFVYAGNLPGRLGEWENTYCPHCDTLLVERVGFHVLQCNITDHVCPACKNPVPGKWT